MRSDLLNTAFNRENTVSNDFTNEGVLEALAKDGQ